MLLRCKKENLIINCSYGFEKKIHTGAAFLDITQAFDRVWHDNCT